MGAIMIKVLLNGTPIYKLCFHRKKYKSLKKRGLTGGQIIQKLNDLGLYSGENEGVIRKQVTDAIRDMFESKPLYETTALVYMVDAKVGEPPVATAFTRQSRLDDNKRDTGREVALGRLLRSNNNPPFNPFERAAIRAAYDNRFKSASKKPTPPASTGTPPIAQVRSAGHSVVSKVIGFPLKAAS
jgi:hypothetical protein